MDIVVRRGATLGFILLTLVAAFAAGGRAAMIIETKGENLLLTGGSEAPLRTLQVLPDGATLKVGKGAVLRLSYFKSGHKEKITGPCAVKLGLNSSEITSGSGKIETQSQRNASTDLDDSSNLRRTGGAMHAGTGIIPENRLAFADVKKAGEGGASPVHVRSGASSGVGRTGHTKAAVLTGSIVGVPKLKFVGLSYVYVTPKEAKNLIWNSAGKTRVEIHTSDRATYGKMVTGKSVVIPVDRLIPGEVHKAVLTGTQSTTSQYFRIFSSDEVDEYERLVKEVKSRESGDPRGLFSELIYLNARLGLLTRARAVAKEAVTKFPKDEGFRAVLNELDQKLGLGS